MVLRSAGYPQLTRAWLGSAQTIIPAVVTTSGWTYAGFYMLIFYSAIKGIPVSLLEAARLDGAAEWKIFLYVIVLLLRPILIIALLLCWTGSFQAFNLFWVMTGEGRALSFRGDCVYLGDEAGLSVLPHGIWFSLGSYYDGSGGNIFDSLYAFIRPGRVWNIRRGIVCSVYA